MLTQSNGALSFPDSLISRCQCLAGVVEGGSPSVADLYGLLVDLPADASPLVRFTIRRVLMRVFARFAAALDSTRDAVLIQAFIAWSRTEACSERWRDDLFALVAVWSVPPPIAGDKAASLVVDAADVHIRRAIDTLDCRYAEHRFTLADLALATNLSHSQIARRLKQQTGRGFLAHLHQRRIAAARMHLTQTTLSIKQVADRVGYTTASEFGRHFRRSSGVTPREYRGGRKRTDKRARAESHDQ